MLQEADDERDLADAQRPLQGAEARERVRRRTLYLTASLLDRGFVPDVPAPAPGEPPPLRYLRPAVDLLRLLTHGDRLFREVLPPIRARLSFLPERVVESRPFQVRGPLDLPATLRGAAGRGEPHPTVLVSRRPRRDHATPENRLTALTLQTVERDAARLLRTLRDRLGAQERRQLGQLHTGAQQTLRLPQLAAAAATLPAQSPADPLRLEGEVQERAVRRPRLLSPYLALVAWRRRYRTWLMELEATAGDSAAWQTDDDNLLYEHLVLLELATALAGRARRARQRRARGHADRPMFAFDLPDGRELELYYQTSPRIQRRYANVRAIPDVSLRVGDRLVLGDMKNYAPGNYTQGVYKLLGYLYTYGYPDRFAAIDGGVLFFPQPSGQHPGWTVLPASPGGQWVATAIVPPEGLTGQAAAWMARLIDAVLDPSTGARS